MSCPFGGPSCFLQESLVAERAIIAFLAESNPSQRKRLASGLSIHARNGIFRDRRSHIKSCLDELLDAQSGQKFSQFKVSYNCQKETCFLNEHISHCVQEEERLKQDKTECAYIASTSKGKDNGKKRKKDNGPADTTPQKKQQKESNDSKVVCYFCKAEEHIKKHCTNFHA
ncbi:UNVERIFIED_CONTAM: hypothetical protein Sangu_2964500 [Sesamum angustifolium]|uniref:Uncharacterized protein n=1 Tax=Sesamum angustifolium TaxID=2727405 RepID=A0AAW2IIR7_9LAMI